MSDQNPSAPAPQVIVVREPSVPAQTPAPAPAPASTEGQDWKRMSEKQFTQRLEEERERGQRQLLASLGIEGQADRNNVLKQIEEGKLALATKQKLDADAKQQMDALQAKAQRADQLEPVFAAFVEEQFKSLPEPFQKYIDAQKKTDTVSRYEEIQKIKSAGLLDAFKATQAQAVAPGAPVAEPKPANPATTVASDPPTAPKPQGALNMFEQWQALKQSGQTVLAANFYRTHMAKIETQRPK